MYPRRRRHHSERSSNRRNVNAANAAVTSDGNGEVDRAAVTELQKYLEEMAGTSRELAVFVTPGTLNFYVATPSSHSQTLTLYNPYRYPVIYRVFSNARERYSVLNPEGTLPPESSVDLIVRHINPTIMNCSSRDLLKIVLHDVTSNQMLGKKVVNARLYPGEKEDHEPDTSTTEAESSPAARDESSKSTTCTTSPSGSTNNSNERSTEILINRSSVIISFVMLIILILPTRYEERENTNIPDYLHVVSTYKLIAAFILGFVICTILRPAGL